MQFPFKHWRTGYAKQFKYQHNSHCVFWPSAKTNLFQSQQRHSNSKLSPVSPRRTANSPDLHSFPYQSTDSFSFKFTTYTYIYHNICNQGCNNVARFTISLLNLCRIAHRSHKQLGAELKGQQLGEAAQGWSRKGGQRIREPRASSKKGSCEIPERN